MKIRDNVLDICNQNLGVSEPGGDDKFISWFNKNILKTWSFAMDVAWCSIFVTYAGVHGGLTGKEFPLTANCDEGMSWFKNRKQWKYGAAYGGDYIPKKGDIVYYSNTHNQNDSTHVGWVESCDGNLMVAVEGNYSNKVKKRTIYLSDPYILGYGIVKFPDEENVESNLVKENKLRGTGIGTGTSLCTMNVRSGANGTYEKIGTLTKGKSVEILSATENDWLKIVWDTAPEGCAYVSNTKPYFDVTWREESYKPKEDFSVGTVVQFKGNIHYTSANAKNAGHCNPGKAKITQFAKGTKHPYHLISVGGDGCTVYGWVDASTILPLSQANYDMWEGKVTASVLNVRTGAGTKHGKLQAWPQLKYGNLIDVLGEVKADDGSKWYYVNIKGHKGYVHSNYVEKV